MEKKGKKQKSAAKAKIKNKRWPKITIIIIASLILLGLLFGGGLYLYQESNLKRELNWELGQSELTLKDLFKRDVPAQAKLATDLKTIDFHKLGDVTLKVKIGKKIKKVKLHIVDTTKPKVEFQDVSVYLDYKFNAEDFVVSVEDQTEVTIDATGLPKSLDFGTYSITVTVKDSSGNTTVGHQNLTIGAVKPIFYLELGDEVTQSDLVYNNENKSAISKSELKKINASDVGEYILKTTVDDREYETKIIITDTTAPTLTLKNVTLYDDAKSIEADAFVKKLKDASKTEVKITSEITFGKLGKQEVTIEAVDAYQNKTTKTATLTIKKDTDAPVISGLSTLKINKNATVDYLKGVSAYDKKDGKVAVKISSNGVKAGTAGTYYVTYTAVDKSGNKATKKREVEVKHDQNDLNNKIKSVASQVGNSPSAIVNYVNEHMRNANTWGENDATWYGLTNWRGNCYVHASVVKALMEAKGYQARLTNTTNKEHYWVLALVNGTWLHFDSVSSYKLIGGTDEERIATLKGKYVWERPSWLPVV